MTLSNLLDVPYVRSLMIAAILVSPLSVAYLIIRLASSWRKHPPETSVIEEEPSLPKALKLVVMRYEKPDSTPKS
jgi:hypothetical protein